ncbi:MAG: transglutaminase-like cysteine peptidase [Gammaproteobacteria bacterium]|jgi:predicted transglutaminase-like cysteine proteinase
MTQHGLHRHLNHQLGIALIAVLLSLAGVSRLVAGDFAPSMEILGQVEQDYGLYARRRVITWYQLISDYQDALPEDKLELVNNFFNQLAFVNDSELWGQEDYWATPLEMLSSNGGDCEDFSIAKYFTLRKMGIPEERMRLTYVKALQLDQAHMVLTYFPSPDAEPLVLDNLVTDIRPSSERTDLLPVYSFNANGLWLAKRKGTDERVGRSARLSRWQEVIARINDEQIPSPR